ncbi:putative hydro-lyase [Colwellia sp. RSH04]|uniref:putative hydro-lyase n=1 Tax=Colwellia sp. RSH04 TaxID=2305464 RepID=UPI000E56E271|nr:putative hydro-lyase [Colwellia sp. RSH04]RHW76499.1 putative hydro-lyase [Colwellia sp. RSH04]
MQQSTPLRIRQQIRNGTFTKPTSGCAPGFVQCNLVILPKEYADDFLTFCQLNPKSCPLIAMSENAGDFTLEILGVDVDIRTDISLYRIYENGELIRETADVKNIWQNNFMFFLLGCSFSFEEALLAENIEVRNISEEKNVPMYKTNISNSPVNDFKGEMVVSMRPLKPQDIERASQICSQFPKVHGAPIHFGNPLDIGITDINYPDFGEAVTIKEGEIPVFWACGVTPQLAIKNAKPPICITHSPGYMLITDIPNTSLRNNIDIQ